jgi:hypothetical protein
VTSRRGCSRTDCGARRRRLAGELDREPPPPVERLVESVDEARRRARATFERLRDEWLCAARGSPLDEEKTRDKNDRETAEARAARLETELAALERGEVEVAYHTLVVVDHDDPEPLHVRARALVARAPPSVYRPEFLEELAVVAPPSLVRARVRDVLDAYRRDGFREENQGAFRSGSSPTA